MLCLVSVFAAVWSNLVTDAPENCYISHYTWTKSLTKSSTWINGKQVDDSVETCSTDFDRYYTFADDQSSPDGWYGDMLVYVCMYVYM